MAEGIIKRHSAKCRSRVTGSCDCNAGWEAWVFSKRENRKIRKTFARKAEAKSWRTDALQALERGSLRASARDKRTLTDALLAHVAGMKDGTIRPKGRTAYKPNTLRSYERAVRTHIAESELGLLRVEDVRRQDVQAVADQLLATGMAASSVSNALTPVQAFYRRALDRETLTYNPAERIDLPDQGDGRPTRIVTVAEAQALLDALPAKDRPLWATAFYAGLRRGELQALRWMDVDLAASKITVERGWDQYEGPIAPKSRASRRTVPMVALLRDYLDEHIISAQGEPEGLIFGRSTSQAFAPSATDKRAKRHWKAAGLAGLSLHGARHTFASLLIDAGANAKAIQAYMGHEKITTTFDTYGHLLPGSHDEVRARMDAYLAAGGDATGAPTGAPDELEATA